MWKQGDTGADNKANQPVNNDVFLFKNFSEIE